jgi:hypothetical protein
VSRRPLRLALVFLGLLVTLGLGYRAFQDERALEAARRQSQSLDRTAEEALSSLSDLRAALHAYVAPGQTSAMWTSRAATLIDTARQRLLSLDAAMSASGGSLADSLDNLDQLAAAEKRARVYVDGSQDLLAGDVIFTEVRDLMAAAGKQVTAAREGLREAGEKRAASLQRGRAMLTVAGVVIWAAIALLLVPTPIQKDTGEWRQKLAEVVKKPVEPEVHHQLAHVAPDVPVAPAPEPSVGRLKPETLKTAAEVCADLSAIVDIGALSGALSRACEVLGASGLVVWVASNDGSLLSPVAAHGFDPNLIMRIGSIRRDSMNLTASAFREGASRVSGATAKLPSALAVALNGPSGPVGVLSAELRAGITPDETCLALATIFAAQLATLALPMPPSIAAQPAWPKQAQA